MSPQTYFSSLVIKYSVCILLKITKIYFSRSGFSLLESVLIGILILFILAIGPSWNVRTSTLTNGSIHLRMDQVKLVEETCKIYTFIASHNIMEKPLWQFFHTIFQYLSGVKTCHFIINRLQRKCFLENIAKSSRTPILRNISERLFLAIEKFIHNTQLFYGSQAITKVSVFRQNYYYSRYIETTKLHC